VSRIHQATISRLRPGTPNTVRTKVVAVLADAAAVEFLAGLNKERIRTGIAADVIRCNPPGWCR